ncbi:MAG: hypothetical protein ACKVRO_07365 [Micropepsaceae bacterium]
MATPQKRNLLTSKERLTLSPEAQVALERLRTMFADREGEPQRSMVDEFLAGRQEMWDAVDAS